MMSQEVFIQPKPNRNVGVWNVVDTLIEISVLYYKTITIILMTIINDATIWSITYDRN
jgi:hypothetical protein